MSSKGTIAKITKQYLKNATKEFDVSCIFTLNLSSLGIFDLGCLNDCTGLVMLDLSNNNISNVCLLAPLKQLQILNLASNRLSSIGGMDELDALSWLDLSSNFINSIDMLRPLRRLEKFAHLRLRDISKGLSNPVCQSNINYKTEVKELLPGLQTLDGELLNGTGSEFSELCEELDVKLKEIKSETAQRRNMTFDREEYPIIAKEDPNSKFDNFEENISLQEKRIQELLQACEVANTEAENTVTAVTKDRIPLAKSKVPQKHVKELE